jgi:hypothetical protein
MFTAKTPRSRREKKRIRREKFQENLVSLSVDSLRTWRLGGKILRFAENRFMTLEFIKSEDFR